MTMTATYGYDDDVLFSASRGGSMTDFCTREGAQALKEKIEAYWRERGHNVLVSLQNVGFHPAIRAARYEIKSDMVNGMPRAVVAAARKTAAPAPAAAEEIYVEDFDDDNFDK
jgi:hypothetical protein